VRDERWDVVIVGAGPAGATAATMLAESRHRVALVDLARHPRGAGAMFWLNTRAASLLTELGVVTKPLLDAAFHEVTFHTADFTKKTEPKIRDIAGYLIDRNALANAMGSRAVSAGVELFDGREVSEVHIKESCVAIQTDDSAAIEGRMLLLATGGASPLPRRIGVIKDASQVPFWCAQVDAPLKPAGTKTAVAVILGLDRRGGFGLCYLTPSRVAIGVHVAGDPTSITPLLVGLCRNALQHGLVPMDLSPSAGKARVLPSPAGMGLDLETHVAKHTLVIGEAGGFVAAASNEGLYPAMWSAKIAAEVADAALRAAKKGAPAQDELMRFDTAWRTQMADYLRCPHTDVQFLLPLIFSNQPMADRMAAAFFFGQNI